MVHTFKRVTEIVRCATNSVDSLIEYYKNPLIEPTPAMIQGSIYHALLLRPRDDKSIPSNIIVINANDFRTKEAQGLKAQALAQGNLPILIKDFEKISQNIEIVRDTFAELINDDNAIFEAEYKGEFDYFGETIGHIDCYTKNAIIDLKISTQSKDLNKVIFDSGYQLQLYLYNRLFAQNRGAEFSDLKVIFFNPNSLTFNIKNINYSEILQECDVLLSRAKYNHLRAMQGLKTPLVSKSDYIPPQWAFKELLESENLGF